MKTDDTTTANIAPLKHNPWHILHLRNASRAWVGCCEKQSLMIYCVFSESQFKKKNVIQSLCNDQSLPNYYHVAYLKYAELTFKPF